MSSRLGVRARNQSRALASLIKGKRPPKDSHFNIHNPRQATDEEIREIRTLQIEGMKKCKVREKFDNLSKCTFESIWSGYTAVHIVPEKRG